MDITTIRKYLIYHASGSLILRFISAGLGLVLSILLARLLGVTQYGLYSYVISWMLLLSTLSILGLRLLLVRNVSAYRSQSTWRLLRGQLQWANQLVLRTSLSVALLTCIFAWWWFNQTSSELLIAFWLGCLLIPIESLNAIRQAALQGFYRVIQGQIPEYIIRPTLFIGTLVIAGLLLHIPINAQLAISFHVGVTFIAFVFGSIILLRCTQQEVKNAVPEYQTRMWVLAALPFFLNTMLQASNNRGGILILGALSVPDSVGLYAAAIRITEPISYMLMALNSALAPTVSDLYSRHNMAELQSVVTSSARVALGITLPIVLMLVLFGDKVLLIFGESFVQALPAVRILVVGELLSVMIGSVGVLLSMTRYARYVTVGVAVSLIVNLLLNIIFIPMWGITGAAFAKAMSIITLNVFLGFWVYKKLSINPTALG